jgi:hypothetical protein
LRVWASRRDRFTLWVSSLGGVRKPSPVSPRGTAPAPPAGISYELGCLSGPQLVPFGRARERSPLAWRSRRARPSFRPDAGSPRIRAGRRLSNAPGASPQYAVERCTGVILGRGVQFLRPRGEPGRLGGQALSRFRLAVHGCIASQSYGELLSDLTIGRLRPVLMERIGAVRRFRGSRAAIRALRGASNPGFCSKAL